LGSEIRIDNGAAIQTSGDLRLVVTPAYRVFALPVNGHFFASLVPKRSNSITSYAHLKS
jgi:hypothetical protein